MNNSWAKIWNTKKLNNKIDVSNEFDTFRELKKADGFDVMVENEKYYYQNFYDNWIKFYNKISEYNMKINSVYEVGCGGGVNLYMFANRGITKLGGIDYSESLISIAKKIIDSDDITYGDALTVNLQNRYDLVMSESVFQYFSSLEYAESVLKMMIEKSNKLVYIGEVHDAEYEDELMTYRKNSIPNYEKRYKDLNKQFYHQGWFEKIARKYGRLVEFEGVKNDAYINAQYEYNCYIF